MADLEGQDGQLDISRPEGRHEQLLLPEVVDFQKKFHDRLAGTTGDNVDLGGHA